MPISYLFLRLSDFAGALSRVIFSRVSSLSAIAGPVVLAGDMPRASVLGSFIGNTSQVESSLSLTTK